MKTTLITKDGHPARNRPAVALLALLLASTLTMPACKKEQIATVLFSKPFSNVSVSIDQLIPDLSTATFSSEYINNCLSVQNPDIDFTFGLGDMWTDAQEYAFPIPLPELSVPPSFEDAIEWPFSFNEPIALHHLHWPDALKEVYSSRCSGTLTLHFSFSGEPPFDKVWLHPFLSEFYLPDYLGVDNYSISEKSMAVEYKNGRVRLHFTNPGMWIPREGLDVTMDVIGLAAGKAEIRGDGTMSLPGSASGSGVFYLYPDDSQSTTGVTYNGSLEVSASISNVHFDMVQGRLKAEMFETKKTVKVPFPRLQDETLNHYNRACLLVDFKRDPDSQPLGTRYNIVQRFFSVGGVQTRTSRAIGTLLGNTCLYMQEPDGVGREGIDTESCPGLKEVFSILPDTVGVCVTCDELPEYLYPGRNDHLRYKSTWLVPLYFQGTNWGKEYRSMEYPLKTLLENAVPGYDMVFSGRYENTMPVKVECTPVFIDEEGTHNELANHKFIIHEFGTGTYSFPRYIFWSIRDERLYFKLKFGEFLDWPVYSGQNLRIMSDKLEVKKYF